MEQYITPHMVCILPRTTEALVLFSIMHQWLQHSWILAKSQLREAAPADLSAGVRITASRVQSFA